MAFNTAPGRAEYTASAAQTKFTFPFKIFNTSDVKVYLTPAGQTADDTVDLLIETTDYTIAINGDNGGDVDLTSGASLNDSITLVRELPTTRTTEYQQNGDLTAEALNEDQDYQTYLILDGTLVKERALVIPDSVQSFDTELPSPVANKILKYNSFANKVDLIDPSSTDFFKDAFIVDSIAAMTGVDHNLYGSVIARGYYTANDGGGGLFNYDATQSAVNNGGTIINGWVRQYSGAVNVKWFGAKGDGATDDATAIQSTIDFLATTGGRIILDKGTFKCSSGVSWTTSNIHIEGSGEGSTTISCSFVSGDIIAVGDGVANPNNCSISRLSITSSVAKTSGAAIRFRNGHNLRIDHIRIDDNMSYGIQFDGGSQQFLYYLNNFEINSGEVGIIIGESDGLVQDIWMSTGIIFGCTDAGILLRHVSGWYFDNIDLLGCNGGITSYPDVGKTVLAGWCNTVITDTCDSHGFKIITNGGLVAELTLVACWGASCGVVDNGHGMHFEQDTGSIKGVSITAPRCINNKGNGIFVESGEDITIANPQCLSNSTQGSGVKHGIEIGVDVSQFSINGGVCGEGGLFGGNNQGYGIFVNSGTSDNYSIIGVNVLGNVTGGISDGGTGNTKHILANKGFRTTNQGVSLIASAASSVTVTHGLDTTPAQYEILANPTVDVSTGGVSTWWVSDVTSTTFKININTATSADLYFAWQTRTKGA